MTGGTETATRTHEAVGGLISAFQEVYPGISWDTATQCLLAMTDQRSDHRLSSNEAMALFRRRLNAAEGRREPWALDVRRAIKRTERGRP